jgi:hypothetical protein
LSKLGAEMLEPFSFKVPGLDVDLFAMDRIDALWQKAPAGSATAFRGDTGRERPPGGPVRTQLTRTTIHEDLAQTSLHLRLSNLLEWAPEYREARDQVLEAAGVDLAETRYVEADVIRIFSPGTPISLNGDGETQYNAGVGGRNVWHFYPPSVLTEADNDALHRDGRYMAWREMELYKTFDLELGEAFGAPPRWPHWIEHPGPDPAISFEIGYWTLDDIRAKKVRDVNWVLRKAKLTPRPPGENPTIDKTKRKLFDAVSLVTRKGGTYRGL